MCTQRCTHQQHRTSDSSQEYKRTSEKIVLLNYEVERLASDLDRQVHNTKPHGLHGCIIRHTHTHTPESHGH